jgi:Protein of unknown function (DUF4239)
MVVLLYRLSDIGIVALFGSIIATTFVTAPLLRHRLIGDVNDLISDVVRASMTPIIGFTGVVLAFSLVQAQGNLRNTQTTVALEAEQLDQLDRLLANYGTDLSAVRQSARDYVQSVISDEWPKLIRHESSDRSATLFRSLAQQVLMIQPETARQNVLYGNLVSIVNQLALSRQNRLSEGRLRLPSVFWQVIASLTVLLAMFAGFVDLRHALTLGGMGAGLALLISLVFIFDQPFLGDVSVTPVPFAQTLQIMTARAAAP